MDADRNSIYDNKKNDQILYLHELMQKYCENLNFELLDLSNSMRKAFQNNQKKFNSKFDSHWDEYGHEFVHRQIIEIL